MIPDWIILVPLIGQIIGSLMTLAFFIWLVKWLKRLETKLDNVINRREDW